jgi:diguanylate cyclase (GGDEF)-like protein
LPVLTLPSTPNLFAPADGLYGFSPVEADAVYAAGRRQYCAAGEVIVERGRPGDCMFILVEGEVEIDLLLQEKLVASRPGDYFGELSFLHPGHPRSASIRAVKDSTLCVLDQGIIDPLYRKHPAAVLNLFRRTCAFLIDAEERLLRSLIEQNEELAASYDYLRRTREALTHQEVLARTDELTGLYNRRCLMEQLARGIEGSKGTPHRVGLLMLDLDRFKVVNDRCGHPAGDELLRNVAGAIKDCIRSEDLPCRYGGDEFAILLHRVEDMPAGQRAEEIRATIAGMPAIRAGAPHVSASIGGTLHRDGDSAESLLSRADAYLYRAKSEGRDRVVWCA